MFVQVARNQLIGANWKTSYKHAYCISSSICRNSCKSRDKKHKSDRELVIECLDRTIKLIESSGVGPPSLSRQYRKDLESCLFKASIQICLSLLISTKEKMDKFVKLLKSQTKSLKSETVSITAKTEDVAEYEEKFDQNTRLRSRKQTHKRVHEVKITVPKSIGKIFGLINSSRLFKLSVRYEN